MEPDKPDKSGATRVKAVKPKITKMYQKCPGCGQERMQYDRTTKHVLCSVCGYNATWNEFKIRHLVFEKEMVVGRSQPTEKGSFNEYIASLMLNKSTGKKYVSFTKVIHVEGKSVRTKGFAIPVEMKPEIINALEVLTMEEPAVGT
jgi:ribosomal protein S27E